MSLLTVAQVLLHTHGVMFFLVIKFPQQVWQEELLVDWLVALKNFLLQLLLEGLQGMLLKEYLMGEDLFLHFFPNINKI